LPPRAASRVRLLVARVLPVGVVEGAELVVGEDFLGLQVGVAGFGMDVAASLLAQVGNNFIRFAIRNRPLAACLIGLIFQSYLIDIYLCKSVNLLLYKLVLLLLILLNLLALLAVSAFFAASLFIFLIFILLHFSDGSAELVDSMLQALVIVFLNLTFIPVVLVDDHGLQDLVALFVLF